MELKSFFWRSMFLFAVSAGTLYGQRMKDVSLQSRYPWSNLVDIDYTIEGNGNHPDGLFIRFDIEDKMTGEIYTRIPLLGKPSIGNGSHRVTGDPSKLWHFREHGRFISTNAVRRGYILRDDPKRYMTIDLSGISAQPVSYSPAPPHDLMLNDVYRTSKLVMRKIDPGSFIMGGTGTQTRYEEGRDIWAHPVALTKAYYMGVFEVTEGQWNHVTGGTNTNVTAAISVSYEAIRGKNEGAKWPESDGIDPDSFIDKIQKIARLEGLDLPTEAQWEYAGRGGMGTELNSGRPLTIPVAYTKNLNWLDEDEPCTHVNEVARSKYNGNDIPKAGLYRPNAWGLYDCHGSQFEWVLDWYVKDSYGIVERWTEIPPAVDPVGFIPPINQDKMRVLRSSNSTYPTWRMKITDRLGQFPDSTIGGFRLSGTVPEQ